jgi:hypothetical protein
MWNFENQFVLILYKYKHIIQVYVIQHNTGHKIHFESNVWADQDYAAKIPEL